MSLLSEWDTYFLGLAEAASKKSKDPRRKVGAVLVSPDRLVVATGYNGIARGLPDDPRVLEEKNGKLEWMIHAEHNAILNAARAGAATVNGTIYVNKFPCLACLQVLSQAGIARVCTDDSDFWRNDPSDRADHGGKIYLLSKRLIQVMAPNHPDYGESLPNLGNASRPSRQLMHVVEAGLNELSDGSGEQLKEARRRLDSIRSGKDSDLQEGRAQALVTCRRVLKTVADAVYPARSEPIEGLDGKTRDLSEDKYIARLWQFFFEHGGDTTSGRLWLSTAEDLGRRLGLAPI